MDKREVCGIVVTFHPDQDFPSRARRIAAQVGALIVIDNASGPAALAMLASLPSIDLVRNARNLGIGQALNAGLARAAERGFRWALLMDQDSLIHENLIDSLIEVLDSQPAIPPVAVVGAGYRDPLERPVAVAGQPSEHGVDEVDWVITSGSLLSLEAYRDIGPFREEFFIDYVDLEYCVRARARGYRVLRARAPLMQHVIGAPTEHRLLWMRKWTSNHSPDRRYYRARNDTVMLRESGRYRSWRLKSLARSVRTCKRVLLYERGKWAKIRAVLQGWWDGIHGRMGIRGEQGR
jgi:rhamnosyltransferase